MVEENIEEKKENIWKRKIIGWGRRKERKRRKNILRRKHSCGNQELREEIKVTILIPGVIKDTLPDKRDGVRAPAN